MRSHAIKDLMISLSEYATVAEDATLYDVVSELEKAQSNNDKLHYPHRAVLVLDQHGHVTGKVSQLDVLRALEPKYDDIRYRYEANLGGFTRSFIQGMLGQFNLWAKPMQDVCRKASTRKVGEFMHTPTDGEFVNVYATLDEAIHQLVMGHHQSLLVVEKERIVGILRLTDVYEAVGERIKACRA